MPRNLTDLMEAAVSAAPPETHHASDITRLAERAQRRRTTFVAGAAALAVVAVAGGTFGLTRGHTTTPEPAAPYKYGQTVDLGQAVAAESLHGYRPQPWTVPSVQDLGPGRGKAATYQQVDAEGRLIVQDWPEGPDAARRTRIYDGPGLAPAPLRVPTEPATTSGRPITWTPSFVGDGRLLWTSVGPVIEDAKQGFHLTDLEGGHAVFVHSHYQVGANTSTSPDHPWVSGDSVWFLSFDKANPDFGTSSTLYRATLSGSLTKVAAEVAAADVADGRVVWVTTDGRVMTASAAGGPAREVSVPLTKGCRLTSGLDLQTTGAHPVAVSRSVIALTQSCGPGHDARQEILAFDLSGRLLVHVTGLFSFNPSLGHDALVFRGLLPSDLNKTGSFRYGLTTGTLATLSPLSRKGDLASPQAAGDYVLWYDRAGGHVADIPD